MKMTIYVELVYNSTFIELKSYFAATGGTEFYNTKFMRISTTVVPHHHHNCSLLLNLQPGNLFFFTFCVQRTNIWTHNMAVLLTVSFPSKQVPYISRSDVKPGNKTGSGKATWFKSWSRYWLSWHLFQCLLANSHIVPTNCQRSLPNPYLRNSRTHRHTYSMMYRLHSFSWYRVIEWFNNLSCSQ